MGWFELRSQFLDPVFAHLYTFSISNQFRITARPSLALWELLPHLSDVFDGRDARCLFHACCGPMHLSNVWMRALRNKCPPLSHHCGRESGNFAAEMGEPSLRK